VRDDEIIEVEQKVFAISDASALSQENCPLAKISSYS